MSLENNNQEKNDKKIIKTAFELAMEKLQSEPPPAVDTHAEDTQNKGRRLAASFLRGEKVNIKKHLQEYSKLDRTGAAEGLKEVFLRNLVLPYNEKVKKECRRALEGFAILYGSTRDVLAMCGQIESLLDEYIKQQKSYFSQLKQQFKSEASLMQQQAHAQFGSGVRINPEQLPGFQKKWQELRSQMDEQYEEILNEHKHHLESLKNL